MTTMANTAFRLCSAICLFLLFFIGVADAGSYCYQDHYTSTTYCAYGCCGSGGSKYCCESNSTVALVVGCVFAGLFIVSVLVVVICCCLKKKGHSGKVVAPAPGSLQTRPGATRSSHPYPGMVNSVHVHHNAAYYPGPGVGAGGWGTAPMGQQPPPPAYSAQPLPPLPAQHQHQQPPPPAYQGPGAPPPPTYDLYASGQNQGPQYPHVQGFGGGMGLGGNSSSQAGMPTTPYGNNFVA